MSSFSDWRLDRDGHPGEIGGRGGNRTPIGWLQASGPSVERLPQKLATMPALNLEPMERIERSSVAYQATALPLSYIGWSQRGYSKPRPPRYECGALPLELLRRGAGPYPPGPRRPLSGPVVCGGAGSPSKLERTEIIEISSLGWRPRAHPIYHARIKTYSIVKDHTSTLLLPTDSKFDSSSTSPIKTKRAAIFGGRPS